MLCIVQYTHAHQVAHYNSIPCLIAIVDCTRDQLQPSTLVHKNTAKDVSVEKLMAAIFGHAAKQHIVLRRVLKVIKVPENN